MSTISTLAVLAVVSIDVLKSGTVTFEDDETKEHFKVKYNHAFTESYKDRDE